MRKKDFFLPLMALLLLGFVARGLLIIRDYSQTFDEAVHITAGYAYWATHDFRMNHEHPPLTKLISSLPVYLFCNPVIDLAVLTDGMRSQWDMSRAFLYDSGESADEMLNMARVPNLLLGACLVVLVARWSYRLWGRRAALMAMALAVFEPTLVAHSSLATTDVGVAFFFFATCYCAWEHIETSKTRWLVACAISLGCTLASKYSGVLAVAVLLLMVVRTALDGRLQRPLRQAFLLAAISLLTLSLCYFGGGIGHWIEGFTFQLRHQQGGHTSFLFGEHSRFGWPYYFPVAFALKMPLGTILLVGLSFLACRGRHASLPLSTILVPLLMLSAGAMCSVNIGLRYMLSVFPYLHLFASRLALVHRHATIFAGLCVAAMASSLWNAPHCLAYFNESIGGPRAGLAYLSDSNLDWGQGLRLLKRYAKSTGCRIVHFDYFGSASPDLRTVPDGQQPVAVVSATRLVGQSADDRLRYRALREVTPIARVGYSLFVYSAEDFHAAHGGEGTPTTSRHVGHRPVSLAPLQAAPHGRGAADVGGLAHSARSGRGAAWHPEETP